MSTGAIPRGDIVLLDFNIITMLAAVTKL